MTVDELRTRCTDSLITLLKSGQESASFARRPLMLACYTLMFSDIPHAICTEQDAMYRGEDDIKLHSIDPIKTLQAVKKVLEGKCFAIRAMDTEVIIGDHLILGADEDGIYAYYNQEFLPKEIMDCLVLDKKDEVRYMNYVTHNSNGFTTTELEVHKTECDLKLNYNDDLPYQQLEDFIKGEESGIVVLNGIPGSGNFKLPFSTGMC